MPGATADADIDNKPLKPTDDSQHSENCSLLRPAMKLNIAKYREAFSNRRLIVDVLAILFGIASWVGINSTYLQLPLLVEVAPEGWNLPSYFVVIIQLANLGPILYTAIQKIKAFRDAYYIYGLLVIGTIAAVMMAVFYDRTAVVFGAERSFAMLLIVFFLALVGCTSSVLFMPYMGRFREIYLITYLIGEGLSGFVPSTVALIQGVGGNVQCLPNNSTDGPDFIRYVPPARFGPNVFFLVVASILMCSTVAFTLLDRLKVCKKEYAAVTIKDGNNYTYETEPKHAEVTGGGTVEDETTTKSKVVEPTKQLSTFNYRYLMVLMFVVCLFANGVFPSIQSYSCLPYGNVAYHLTVTLSSIANPVACFLAVFLPHHSVRHITLLTILAGLVSVYALSTAFLSPNPPLQGTGFGTFTVVATWTFLVGLHSYVRLSINTVFRFQGGKSLVWIGAVSQFGSFIGAIISFGLVNFTSLFTSYEPC